MKKAFLIFSLLVLVAAVQAHEFWLQPQKFRFNVGEILEINFKVGENFEGDYWDLTRHKVERLDVYTTKGKTDISKDVKPGKNTNLSYILAVEGTHLFVMQSNAAFIELEGEKFNAYLKEDGLDNILDQRTSKGELGNPAKEYYTRFAKLLIQSGVKTDEIFKQPIGLKHEIIPLQNPSVLKVGDNMECQILFKNKPAAHQMVKVWNRVDNRTFLQNLYTGKDGVIKFPISAEGYWMVSTVRMDASQNAAVDYESSWASLIFGIE